MYNKRQSAVEIAASRIIHESDSQIIEKIKEKFGKEYEYKISYEEENENTILDISKIFYAHHINVRIRMRSLNTSKTKKSSSSNDEFNISMFFENTNEILDENYLVYIEKYLTNMKNSIIVYDEVMKNIIKNLCKYQYITSLEVNGGVIYIKNIKNGNIIKIYPKYNHNFKHALVSLVTNSITRGEVFTITIDDVKDDTSGVEVCLSFFLE